MRPKIRTLKSSGAEQCSEQFADGNFELRKFRQFFREVESAFAPLPPKNEEAAQVSEEDDS